MPRQTFGRQLSALRDDLAAQGLIDPTPHPHMTPGVLDRQYRHTETDHEELPCSQCGDQGCIWCAYPEQRDTKTAHEATGEKATYTMEAAIAGPRDYHCSIFVSTRRGEYRPHLRPSKDLQPGDKCFKVYNPANPYDIARPACFRQRKHAKAWMHLLNS